MEQKNKKVHYNKKEILNFSKFKELDNLKKENNENIIIQDLGNNHFKVNTDESEIFFIKKDESIYVIGNNIKNGKIEKIYPEKNILSIKTKSNNTEKIDFFFYNEVGKVSSSNGNFISADLYHIDGKFISNKNKELYDKEFNLIGNGFNENIDFEGIKLNGKKIESIVNIDFKNGIFTINNNSIGNISFLFDTKTQEVKIDSNGNLFESKPRVINFSSNKENDDYFILKINSFENATDPYNRDCVGMGFLINGKIKYIQVNGKNLINGIEEINTIEKNFKYKDFLCSYNYNDKTEEFEANSLSNFLIGEENREHIIKQMFDINSKNQKDEKITSLFNLDNNTINEGIVVNGEIKFIELDGKKLENVNNINQKQSTFNYKGHDFLYENSGKKGFNALTIESTLVSKPTNFIVDNIVEFYNKETLREAGKGIFIDGKIIFSKINGKEEFYKNNIKVIKEGNKSYFNINGKYYVSTGDILCLLEDKNYISKLDKLVNNNIILDTINYIKNLIKKVL